MLTIPVGSDDHIQGDAKAAVILVEYGDYECPHCGAAYPIVKRIQKHLGTKLGFVFRNFPLNEIQPNAEIAAETAEFAGPAGKFWEMHDAIFEHQRSLSEEMLVDLAGKLHLPKQGLQEALEEGTFRERVRADFIGGVRSGVNGTPTFFINGDRHEGPFDYETLVAALEAGIKSA